MAKTPEAYHAAAKGMFVSIAKAIRVSTAPSLGRRLLFDLLSLSDPAVLKALVQNAVAAARQAMQEEQLAAGGSETTVDILEEADLDSAEFQETFEVRGEAVGLGQKQFFVAPRCSRLPPRRRLALRHPA